MYSREARRDRSEAGLRLHRLRRMAGPPEEAPPSGEVPLRDEQAVHEQLDRSGGQGRGVDAVRAARVLISSRSCAASGWRIATVGARPFAFTSVAFPIVRATSSTSTVSTVTTRSRSDRNRRQECDRRPRRDSRRRHRRRPSRPRRRQRHRQRQRDQYQFVDGQLVGAAEGIEVDRFDAGSVHRDGPLSSEEPEAVAVRRQVDLLAAVGPVEHHCVVAVLASDGVAAVTRIPDEGVVAGAEECDVVATVAVDRVVAVTACAASRRPARRRSCRLLRRRLGELPTQVVNG